MIAAPGVLLRCSLCPRDIVQFRGLMQASHAALCFQPLKSAIFSFACTWDHLQRVMRGTAGMLSAGCKAVLCLAADLHTVAGGGHCCASLSLRA